MEIAILAQESGAMAWIRRSVAVGAVILMFPLRRVLKAQAAGSRGADAAHLGPAPKLKGSIGEGPNHSNFSDQSSVKLLAKFRNFRQKIKTNSGNFNIF